MKNFIKKIKLNSEKKQTQNPKGFVIIFALILVSILLSISLTVSRLISKELYFTRLIDFSKVAYSAAESGIDCALYVDSVYRNASTGVSVFPNNSISLNPFESINGISDWNEILCGGDNDNNKIFNNNNTNNNILDQLKIASSSYKIEGNDTSATTTFGFVLQGEAGNKFFNKERCVIISFFKQASSTDTSITSSYKIISTGFSSCDIGDKNTIARSIQKFSN